MSATPGEIDFERLLQVFVEEATESLEVLDEALLTLSDSPADSGALAEAFRRLHTLKGDAGTVDLPHIAEFLHRLEDLFDTARHENLGVSARAVAVMFDATDLLREMIAALPEQRPAHRERATEISRRLDAPGELLVSRSEAVEGAGAQGAERAASLLRVPIERLDALVDRVGELAVSRTQFGLRLATAAVSHAELVELHRESDRLFLDLQEAVLRLRMVPIGRALQRYRRLVRQLAEQLGKKVRLQVDGSEVEVDAGVVARLIDPLSHLLRNAVDHGIEAARDRVRLGKNEVGVVGIAVSQEPGHVVVRVSDDGRGLDRQRLAAKALHLGAIDRTPASPEAIDRLVFLSGLSTADHLNQVSGRGVGMDVVLQQVESLRGTVAVENRPGEGTSFVLRLPLSLAVIDGFYVEVGGDTYVLPIESVVSTAELAGELATQATGLLPWRGKTLPFLRLRDAFGFPTAAPERQIAVIVGGDAARAARRSRGRSRARPGTDRRQGDRQCLRCSAWPRRRHRPQRRPRRSRPPTRRSRSRSGAMISAAHLTLTSGPRASAHQPREPESNPYRLSDHEFHLLRALIERLTGIQIPEAKRLLLVGRLARRLRELGLESFATYYGCVIQDETERVRMIDAITTNETRFFREPQQFEFLERQVLPAWAAAAAGRRRRIRVWSAACSTGEEPFSIAMTLLSQLPDWDIEILATDLSTRALDKARAALWPIEKCRDIPERHLKAFMLRGTGEHRGYMKAGQELRRLVRFERLNLHDVHYPVDGLFELIFTRNVLIYFSSNGRASVVSKLIGHLAPEGCLLLGHAETLNGITDRLSTVGPTVYSRARGRHSTFRA